MQHEIVRTDIKVKPAAAVMALRQRRSGDAVRACSWSTERLIGDPPDFC
jgi:hypothetical protein